MAASVKNARPSASKNAQRVSCFSHSSSEFAAVCAAPPVLKEN